MFWNSGITSYHKTPTFKRLAVFILLFAVYVFAIIYTQEHYCNIDFEVPHYMMYILGYVIMIFFYFRLNNSYYRWYEGRKALSYLTANSETFMIKLRSYLPSYDKDGLKFMQKMTMNYMVAVKMHLRNKGNLEELEEVYPGFKESLKGVLNVPNALTKIMHQRVNEWYKSQYITKYEYWELNRHIEKSNINFEACDAIRTTKTTKSYIAHVRMFLVLFTLCLPFGFKEELEYWMIPVLAIIMYGYFGCDVMSEEVENPFGNDQNDLPLEVICHDVDQCLNQVVKS